VSAGRTTFRVLDYVTTPGSPVSTKASFIIHDGVPGLVAN
jgi:alkaline phosphatase D